MQENNMIVQKDVEIDKYLSFFSDDIEYAVNMTDKTYIDIECLPLKLKNINIKVCDNNISDLHNLHTIEELERNEIKKALKLYGISNNAVIRICAELGISRATFYRKIKKYNLISNQILIND